MATESLLRHVTSNHESAVRVKRKQHEALAIAFRALDLITEGSDTRDKLLSAAAIASMKEILHAAS